MTGEPDEAFTESFEDAVNRLSKTNNVCGRGTHGICFNGNMGQVIKLHPKKDRAYIDFIKFVRTLNGEEYVKHFPKIFYFEETGEYITLVIEQLYWFDDLPTFEQDNLPAIVTPVSNVSIRQALDHAQRRLEYALQVHRGTDYMFNQSWKAFKVIPTLEDALQALLLHVWCNGYACDLHDKNLLFRKLPNGSCDAVIIDPFTCMA